jgi:hypothetical protein
VKWSPLIVDEGNPFRAYVAMWRTIGCEHFARHVELESAKRIVSALIPRPTFAEGTNPGRPIDRVASPALPSRSGEIHVVEVASESDPVQIPLFAMA